MSNSSTEENVSKEGTTPSERWELDQHWSYRKREQFCYEILDDSGNVITSVSSEPDARLIAAAPLAIETLKSLLKELVVLLNDEDVSAKDVIGMLTDFHDEVRELVEVTENIKLVLSDKDQRSYVATERAERSFLLTDDV